MSSISSSIEADFGISPPDTPTVQRQQNGEDSVTFSTSTFSRTFQRTIVPVGQVSDFRTSYLKATDILPLKRLEMVVDTRYHSLPRDVKDSLMNHPHHHYDGACIWDFLIDSNRLVQKFGDWITELEALDDEAIDLDSQARRVTGGNYGLRTPK
ncbi:MAG: hypothetical protein Q9221_004763 [Calogaya cf. arnoldii]